MNDSSIPDGAKKQTTGLAMGAAYGAITGTSFTPKHPNHRLPNLAIQVGSAATAAARHGAGVAGSIAAGGAVVTAKVAAAYAVASTAAVALAPFAAGAAVGYGLYQLWKKL